MISKKTTHLLCDMRESKHKIFPLQEILCFLFCVESFYKKYKIIEKSNRHLTKPLLYSPCGTEKQSKRIKEVFEMKRTRMMVTTLAMAMMALGGTTAAFAAEGEAAVACTPAVEATSVEVDEMKLTDDMEGTVAVAVVAAQEAQKVTGENDTVPMEKLEKVILEALDMTVVK